MKPDLLQFPFNVQKMLEEQDFEQAKGLCLKGVKAYPKTLSGYRLLVDCFLALDDVAGAENVLANLPEDLLPDFKLKMFTNNLNQIVEQYIPKINTPEILEAEMPAEEESISEPEEIIKDTVSTETFEPIEESNPETSETNSNVSLEDLVSNSLSEDLEVSAEAKIEPDTVDSETSEINSDISLEDLVSDALSEDSGVSDEVKIDSDTVDSDIVEINNDVSFEDLVSDALSEDSEVSDEAKIESGTVDSETAEINSDVSFDDIVNDTLYSNSETKDVQIEANAVNMSYEYSDNISKNIDLISGFKNIKKVDWVIK